MTYKEKNQKLFSAWVDKGLAVADAGDGAWWWTAKAVAMPRYDEARYYLSALLYKDVRRDLFGFEVELLKEAGFDKKGFPLDKGSI